MPERRKEPCRVVQVAEAITVAGVCCTGARSVATWAVIKVKKANAQIRDSSRASA